MIFGNPATFAIETGIVERSPLDGSYYVQFRFWIDSQPIGDWEDRIPLVASIQNASVLCANQNHRQDWLFKETPPDGIFQLVYDKFFEYDYSKDPILIPNLRDRFHLDDIGMGAIQDRYGLVLVGSTSDSERIIVKNLKSNIYLTDMLLNFGCVESTLNAYVEWGRSQGRLKSV